MIFALVVSALAIEHTAILVAALIIIGFFSGFYMVPLYTLLQHRAPKKSKGELVATSNFVNVTGAIAASLLFGVLVWLGQRTNITPEVPVTDNVAVGKIKEIDFVKHKPGKIEKVIIDTKFGEVEFQVKGAKGSDKKLEERETEFEYYRAFGFVDDEIVDFYVDFDENFFDALAGALKKGDDVIVARHDMRGVRHFLIRKSDQSLRKIHDNERLPTYLFFGAALMTLGILILLVRKLPDFFVRMLFWMRSLGKFRIKSVNMHNLPTEGPVILATNCKNLTDCLQLVSATDRSTKVVLIDNGGQTQEGPLLRMLARRTSLIIVRPGDGEASWMNAKKEAIATLNGGHLLAVSLDHEEQAGAVAALVHQLHIETNAPLLPVFCGSLDEGAAGVSPRIRVVFGEIQTLPHPALESESGPLPELHALENCKKAIAALGEWIRHNDDSPGTGHH